MNDQDAQRSGATVATRIAADSAATASHNHLPTGTRLGEFEILQLIGEGGFGIVYLAYDHSLQRNVALKEYMPSQLATRSADATVSVRSEKFTETFEIGRRSFINEARLLAQFDQPALVKVHRFWEANGTAYMAMPFYEGITLREARKRMAQAPDEEWIERVLGPVMDALELIHAQQCFHRDIAPDNIMLIEGERPVLLDFGAARKVIGDATQALTVILKPGYAPIEQYAEVPGMKQGAWTDIYALAAVIHFLLTEETPPVAVGRIVRDEYVPLAERRRGKYPPRFLQGVDRCLSVKPEDRPQSIAETRRLLGFGESLMAPAAQREPSAPPSPSRPAAASSALPAAATGGSRTLINLAVIGGVALLAAGAAWYLLANRAPTPTPAPPPEVATPVRPPDTPPAPPPLAVTPRQPAVAPEETFARLAAQAEARLTPQVDGLRAISAPDGRALALVARGPVGGYFYVLAFDPRRQELTLVFPNARDSANAVAAGQTLTLPRPGWSYALGTEAREVELLVMFSEHPRQFPALAGQAGSDFAMLPAAALTALLAGGEGVAPLAGLANCASPDCARGFGATQLSLRLGEAAPPATAERPPAATRPTERRVPASPRQDTPADQQQSEKEYMKQLNRDLDKLLGEPPKQ